MGIFTISPDLLRSIAKDEGIYFTEILFVFAQRGNTNKVSKDKKGDIIRHYSSIDSNLEIIKMWLDLMSFKPSPFEVIDVDLENINCEETKFLTLCKASIDPKKMIVYSKANLKKHQCYNGWVGFENETLKILDRDEAIIELAVQQANSGDTYINSQIAKNSSTINKSNNNGNK